MGPANATLGFGVVAVVSGGVKRSESNTETELKAETEGQMEGRITEVKMENMSERMRKLVQAANVTGLELVVPVQRERGEEEVSSPNRQQIHTPEKRRDCRQEWGSCKYFS